MPAVSRLYLDTNIFIALGEGSDDISTVLYELIGRQVPDEDFLFTSELSLAELLVQPYRQKNDELVSLYDNWIRPGSWLTVGPVDRSVLWYAAQVRVQYNSIKLPDAIHLSTAIGFECTHFLTGDKRIPDEIELWHERWGMVRGPSRLSVIRLSVDMVRELVAERRS